jgi:hypothetical protein
MRQGKIRNLAVVVVQLIATIFKEGLHTGHCCNFSSVGNLNPLHNIIDDDNTCSMTVMVVSRIGTCICTLILPIMASSW